MRKIDKEAISVVLIGKFNPAIFQPLWFSSEQLIRKSEGEEAKIELIHPDATIFALDWIRIEVLHERIVFSSLHDEHEELIADLILNTFRLLRHTPIFKLGINKEVVFTAENEKDWHKIGNTLAPKTIWNSIVKNPGMNSLTIQSERDADIHKGYIRTKVEPYSQSKYGVLIKINDHYEIDIKKDEIVNSDEILKIFENEWRNSLEKSTSIIKYLMENL
ncbi:MAG: hypothetical protein JXJ04_17170 [Spirochaetales bacterium]|nr:hypothetical protein [Spirochaetales bacterium]